MCKGFTVKRLFWSIGYKGLNILGIGFIAKGLKWVVKIVLKGSQFIHRDENVLFKGAYWISPNSSFISIAPPLVIALPINFLI